MDRTQSWHTSLEFETRNNEQNDPVNKNKCRRWNKSWKSARNRMSSTKRHQKSTNSRSHKQFFELFVGRIGRKLLAAQVTKIQEFLIELEKCIFFRSWQSPNGFSAILLFEEAHSRVLWLGGIVLHTLVTYGTFCQTITHEIRIHLVAQLSSLILAFDRQRVIVIHNQLFIWIFAGINGWEEIWIYCRLIFFVFTVRTPDSFQMAVGLNNLVGRGWIDLLPSLTVPVSVIVQITWCSLFLHPRNCYRQSRSLIQKLSGFCRRLRWNVFQQGKRIRLMSSTSVGDFRFSVPFLSLFRIFFTWGGQKYSNYWIGKRLRFLILHPFQPRRNIIIFCTGLNFHLTNPLFVASNCYDGKYPTSCIILTH